MNNKVLILSALFAFVSIAPTTAEEVSDLSKNTVLEEGQRILAIAGLYLECTTKGDYQQLLNYASPVVQKNLQAAKDDVAIAIKLKGLLLNTPLRRTADVGGSDGKLITGEWTISSISRNADKSYYIILKSGDYLSARAVAELQDGQYVLTKW